MILTQRDLRPTVLGAYPKASIWPCRGQSEQSSIGSPDCPENYRDFQVELSTCQSWGVLQIEAAAGPTPQRTPSLSTTCSRLN